VKSTRPGSGLIVSIIALVVATSGSAVAASLITSKQIKDGTIQLKDINRNARVGLAGDAGPQGARGSSGAPGVSGYQLVSSSVDFDSDAGGRTLYSGSVHCPAGKKILGAGGWVLTYGPTYTVALDAERIGEQLTSDGGYAVSLNSEFAIYGPSRLTVTAACAFVG